MRANITLKEPHEKQKETAANPHHERATMNYELNTFKTVRQWRPASF
jgi:hypothetical protein